MPLTRQIQNATFRFGGATAERGEAKDENFDPQKYLDSLSDKDLNTLFNEWIAQCWLYTTDHIPRTQEELAEFDLTALFSKFRARYISGDWRDITQGSGASIDEMILCWQLLSKVPHIVMLSNDKPAPPNPPEFVKTYEVDGPVLFANFLRFVELLEMPPRQVFVTDGIIHHVLTFITYNKNWGVVIFKDNIGSGGKCFLNKENNALGIDVKFVDHPKPGDWYWEISLKDFETVFYGVPLEAYAGRMWNLAALENAKERGGDLTLKDTVDRISKEAREAINPSPPSPPS